MTGSRRVNDRALWRSIAATKNGSLRWPDDSGKASFLIEISTRITLALSREFSSLSVTSLRKPE